MRDPTLTDLFVRDLDRIPLPPREQWIRRPAVEPLPSRGRMAWWPALATVTAVLLVAVALVSLQAPGVSRALDRLGQLTRPADPYGYDDVNAALLRMIALELAAPAAPRLLEAAAAEVDLLLRDRGSAVRVRRPTYAGPPEADFARFREALSDVARASGTPPSELQDAAIQGMALFERGCGSYFVSDASKKAGANAAQFAGLIGVRFGPPFSDGAHQIFTVFAGSPAERAGLRPGDVIVSVDGRRPASPGELRALLRGNPGTVVSLEVARAGRVERVVIERTALAPPTLSTRLVDGSIAYLDLRAEVSMRDISAAIDLLDADARAWIIDLRMDSWPEGALIERGLIARLGGPERYGIAIDRSGSEAPLLADPPASRPAPRPIVLLVNGQTHTSPLVVAAALQEAGVVVVGEPTSGCAFRYELVSLVSGDLFIRTRYVETAATRRDLRAGVAPDILVRGGPPGDPILEAAVGRLREQLR